MADNAFDMTDAQADPLTRGSGKSAGRAGSPRKIAYKAHMTRANIVLAALLIAGGVTVYVLSPHGGPAEVTAEEKLIEINVDTAILRLKGAPAVGPKGHATAKVTKGLLESFSEQIVRQQVPLAKLSKNPFIFVRPAVMTVSAAKQVKKSTEPKNEAEEVTHEQAAEMLSKLTLQTVMMGSKQVAIISDNLLSVGEKIEMFTVKRIDPKMVVLTWKDSEFELKMESPGD